MAIEVVVTGISAITGAGIGISPLEHALRNGQSCIKQVEHFDTDDLQCKIGATIPDFRAADFMSKTESRRLNRGDQLFAVAGLLALEQSKLLVKPIKTGICQGTSLGGIPTVLSAYKDYLENGYKRLSPLTMLQTTPGLGATLISKKIGIKGPTFTFSNGTVSSAYAVASAYQQIKSGSLDAIITGGGDAAVTRALFLIFQRAKILSINRNDDPSKAFRPFDSKRNGFVLGEGAAALILESREHATRRGANILAIIKSISLTSDAESFVAPATEPIEKARAIKNVIQDAEISPLDLDYTSAHGTGTKLNDTSETEAVKMALGSQAYKIPMSAMKSIIGHTLGACSAIELVSTILAMRAGFVPPTLNLNSPDPKCDLDYVPNSSRLQEINYALINNSGFGGRNSSILVENNN